MADEEKSIRAIEKGETSLGIELGSTRIKAVLIDSEHQPIAKGYVEWENRFINGIWTYSIDEVIKGLQGCYADLLSDVREKYGVELITVGSIGISAMMHGYMAFGKSGELLVPFRTWRNTTTGEAAKKLTELFGYNIPQRWSIAHLYQAILNRETSVPEITYLTTLAGFIHWKLTGRKVTGVGDASGMFPIDPDNGGYDVRMAAQFDSLIAENHYPWRLEGIMPKVLPAGENAGTLSEEGAKLLDPTGKLRPGIPFCPPEGDAGTGMVATNSVKIRTGNISAGTSIFAMIVLDRQMSRVYPEIDLVTTPSGKMVAMVHCNNCTGDIDAWIKLFGEFADTAGTKVEKDRLYKLLYGKALEGESDCGGLLSYNYYSGEPVTGFDKGRPLFIRKPDSRFTLANFMRANLYAALASLRLGLDNLFEKENVKVDCITGHGGFFKTRNIGQHMMAAAINKPVTVMDTAGEGGPWGMAVLAAYMRMRKERETLENYLDNRVFCKSTSTTVSPDRKDAEGFERFLREYKEGLPIERAAGSFF